MEANKIETKILIISFVTAGFIEAATRSVISKGLSDRMVILGATRLLEIILLVLIVLTWGRGLCSIGLARSKLVPGLRKGLIWSAVFGILASFVFVALFFAGINALTLIRAHVPRKPSEIIPFFFIGGVVGPVAEEIFFRGILYGFFRRWGTVAAVVLSTLIFVLAHPIFPGIPLPQVVGGIVFAVAYEVEGRLMVPITIHALGNMAIFLLSWIT